jgi:hypothetical protein
LSVFAVLPGVAEQLDFETQQEQAKFRGLVWLCLMGLLFWYPICVRTWSPESELNRIHVSKPVEPDARDSTGLITPAFAIHANPSAQ